MKKWHRTMGVALSLQMLFGAGVVAAFLFVPNTAEAYCRTTRVCYYRFGRRRCVIRRRCNNYVRARRCYYTRRCYQKRYCSYNAWGRRHCYYRNYCRRYRVCN